MGVIGRGWSKLLLFGEHAAVYGHPAVGLTLNDSTSVGLTITGRREWEYQIARYDREAARDRKVLADLLSCFEQILPAKVGRGRIEIESSIPRGLGFGSSAALCTAFSSAFYAVMQTENPQQTGRNGETLQSRDESRRTIWEWSHRAEKLFHGTPSGIDTGLSLMRGLYRFLPKPPLLPLAERLNSFPLYLVIGAVPRIKSTGTLISRLRERIDSGDRDLVKILNRLGELSGKAVNIFRNSDGNEIIELGALARHAHDLLSKLDLSTPDLDFLLEEGNKAGALGGKLSGAGGGGAFFLFMPDWETALSAKERIFQAAVKMKIHTEKTVRALAWEEGNITEKLFI